MAGSINKVILIGNVGNQPEIRISQSSGEEVVNFSVATNEKWKDKNTGKQREKTDWHKVVVFSSGLVKIVKTYISKGSKVYIEGKLQTREYQDQIGVTKYTTEIILNQYNSNLVLLDFKKDTASSIEVNKISYNQKSEIKEDINKKTDFDSNQIDDEIPF